MTFEKQIEELQKIDKEELMTARYSTDTAYKIKKIADEIRQVAREVNQCCY